MVASIAYENKLYKIDLSKPSPVLDTGTAVHAACENFLKTRVMDPTITFNMLDEAWKKNAGVDGFNESSLAKAKQEDRKSTRLNSSHRT